MLFSTSNLHFLNIFFNLCRRVHTYKIVRNVRVLIQNVLFFTCRPGYNPNERPTTPEKMKRAAPPDRLNMHPIYPMLYKKLLLVTKYKDFEILICTMYFYKCLFARFKVICVCMYVFIMLSVANYGAALVLLDQPVERAHLLLPPWWILWISSYPGIDQYIHITLPHTVTAICLSIVMYTYLLRAF